MRHDLRDRLAAVQSQRPLDRLRPGRHALHLDRRRRLRQRLGHRPQRRRRERSGSARRRTARSSGSTSTGPRTATTTPSRPTIRSSARRPRRCPRSGPTACATRGAARSTWAATTSCSAATSSRTATRRSNIIEKGGNHGWRLMEATHCFDYSAPNQHPESCDTSGLVMPILEYANCTAIGARPKGQREHTGAECEGISVTGGYVYRGSHADWDGKYIFGDWSRNFASDERADLRRHQGCGRQVDQGNGHRRQHGRATCPTSSRLRRTTTARSTR